VRGWVYCLGMERIARTTAASLVLFVGTVSGGMPGQPENSYIRGSNWYCNSGYEKSGQRCVSIFANFPNGQPENSYIRGSNWYCNSGYEKSGQRCVSIFANFPNGQPENSYIRGSNWYCNSGYEKSGQRCVSIFEKATPRIVDSINKFLATNARKSDVVVTASGLQYRVIESGTGPKPVSTDNVLVHYEGRLTNGQVFDSSVARGEPIEFPLSGVIPGWKEGVMNMPVGAKYELVIPSNLAYGSAGNGPIPPNSTLIFEVSLLGIPNRGISTTTQPQMNDSKSEQEIARLRRELDELKKANEKKKIAVSEDSDPPTIAIVQAEINGSVAKVVARVNDTSGIGEVRLNGLLPKKVEGALYSWETFIPLEGLSVLIEATDIRGQVGRKLQRLSRAERQVKQQRLAALNPLVGPKQKPSRDRAALIIGVETYASAPSADFASRDAQMFADYAREKLGIPDNNIKVLTDTGATETEVLRALKVWLPKAVKPDTTDLYVFYAGHGMPTADGTSAYLVPYDGDIQLLEDTAISRKRFFDEISATKPRSATFFFDNCYSGATRSEQQLLAARPLTIKVEETDVPDNYLVFAAGETDQIAGVEPEVKHGRFSYFVFKGLEGEADANSDGKISAGELHKYVGESVGRFSAGAQTPTMLGDAGRWVLR